MSLEESMTKAASDDNDLWFALEAWMCTPWGIFGWVLFTTSTRKPVLPKQTDQRWEE